MGHGQPSKWCDDSSQHAPSEGGDSSDHAPWQEGNRSQHDTSEGSDSSQHDTSTRGDRSPQISSAQTSCFGANQEELEEVKEYLFDLLHSSP